MSESQQYNSTPISISNTIKCTCISFRAIGGDPLLYFFAFELVKNDAIPAVVEAAEADADAAEEDDASALRITAAKCARRCSITRASGTEICRSAANRSTGNMSRAYRIRGSTGVYTTCCALETTLNR